MVGIGFGIVASSPNIPQPLHQWDGNGEVCGADDAVKCQLEKYHK
jgi:hypothetical protein